MAEATPMREQRKVITALYADLVGSTALGERLDPEDTREVVGEAIARIIGVIEPLGGTIKDLAGDGVLALYGAPVAHEDDAERAVRAGLEIVERISEYGQKVARERSIDGFGVRVGIESGLVVLGPVGAGGRIEYGATGDAVNTTARIQAAARPGSVLVGPSTYRLVEPLFTWGERRELTLKGKAEPLFANEATGLRAAGIKRRGIAGVETPLVGRERELAAGRHRIEALLGGEGGVLVLTGEPGIGKSRLLVELRKRLEEGGGTWLEGRCVSYGETLPYWPFRELLRDWLGVSPAQPEADVRIVLRNGLEAHFGETAADLYPYLGAVLGLKLEPDAADALAQLSPETLQYRTFEAVESLLGHLAGSGPTVAAIEDLHWADPTSVQLVERLLVLGERHALLLVVAQRPERDHSSQRLAERAARHGTVITLEALPEDADRALLVALVGEETLPEALERRILSTGEGNPFFLEELVRSLIDSGALVRQDGDWRFEREVQVEIPETVEKVVLARIDRLDESTYGALTAACVLGRHFGLELLRAVEGGEGALDEALAELERLDLIRRSALQPQPEYRFKHALIQEAAYSSLLRKRRAQLHRRAAQAIESLFREGLEEHYGVLAHHYRSAGDFEKALHYHSRAATAARRVYAVEEALRHYTSALEVAASLERESVADLQLQRGLVRAQTGDIAGARSDFEDTLMAARADQDRSLEMQTLNHLGFLLAGAADYRKAIPLLEAGLALADELDDSAGQVSILSRLSIVFTNRLRLDRAYQHSQRAIELARELGDRRALALALDSLEVAAVMVGDFSTVDEISRQLVETHREHADLWYLQHALYQWSWVPHGLARWDEATARLEEGLAINHRIGDVGVEPVFHATLGWIHRERGQYEPALERARLAVAQAREVEHPEMTAWSEGVLAAILLELHAFEDAAEHLEAALETAERAGAQIQLVRALGLRAWTVSLAHEPEAAALIERTRDVLGGVTAPPGRAYLQGADAWVALAQAHLARDEPRRGQELLEPLLAAAEVSGWREAISSSALVLGRCLARLGDSTGARQSHRRALAVAEENGLRPLAWQARAALGDTDGAAALVEELSRGIKDESIRTRYRNSALDQLKSVGSEGGKGA